MYFLWGTLDYLKADILRYFVLWTLQHSGEANDPLSMNQFLCTSNKYTYSYKINSLVEYSYLNVNNKFII